MWLAIGPSFGWWMFRDRALTRPDGHFQYTRPRNVRPAKLPKNPANTMGAFFVGRDNVRVTSPIAEPNPDAAHETKHLGQTQPLGERRRRRALDQMVALSLLEVGIDEHGMRRYGLTEWGRAWRFPYDVDWPGRADLIEQVESGAPSARMALPAMAHKQTSEQ